MTTLIEHFQLSKAIFFRMCDLGHVDVARVFAFVYRSVHFNSHGYFTQFAHENCQIPVKLKNRVVMIFSQILCVCVFGFATIICSNPVSHL